VGEEVKLTVDIRSDCGHALLVGEEAGGVYCFLNACPVGDVLCTVSSR
jgi:hypothetical protein